MISNFLQLWHLSDKRNLLAVSWHGFCCSTSKLTYKKILPSSIHGMLFNGLCLSFKIISVNSFNHDMKACNDFPRFRVTETRGIRSPIQTQQHLDQNEASSTYPWPFGVLAFCEHRINLMLQFFCIAQTSSSTPFHSTVYCHQRAAEEELLARTMRQVDLQTAKSHCSE